MKDNYVTAYYAVRVPDELEPGRGYPCDSLNVFRYRQETKTRRIISKLRITFKENIEDELSEYVDDPCPLESFILKCFDDALIEVLLGED